MRNWRIQSFIFLSLLLNLLWAKKAKQDSVPTEKINGIYMICDARFFSFIDLKKNGSFIWEYHDEEAHIFQSKGQWLYKQEEKKLYLNPTLNLQKQFAITPLADKENTRNQKKLIFYLNGKRMPENGRTNVAWDRQELKPLNDSTILYVPISARYLNVEFNPGLKAEAVLPLQAGIYKVDLQIPRPDEILLRDGHLLRLDHSFLVEPNLDYSDLFFERQLNKSIRFFNANSKDLSNCPRNVHRIQTGEATADNNNSLMR